MGWKFDITKELQIFMGDGETYSPEWLNATIKTSYNVSTFEFPEVEGTLVQRQKRKGEIYDIEFYFQGDDNIQVAERFRRSAEDPRHWHIRHPFYGDLRVQPVSGLSFDNTKYNVTKITGAVQETITGIFPRGLDNPQDEIQGIAEEILVFGSESYNNAVKSPQPTDISNASGSVDSLNESTKKIITDNKDSADFQNLVKRSKQDVSKMSSDALQAMLSVQNVIMFPARANSSVTARIGLLSEQFDRTSNAIRNADYILPMAERSYYEVFGGTLISASLLAASTPNEGDFTTSSGVENVTARIVSMWNTYLLDLDNLQFYDPASVESYLPDAENIAAIDNMLSLTLSSLFDIALEARSEFSILLDKDSNAVILTNKYYGLDADDSNLDFFLETNSIGLNEMLLIKKGRKILYYL